MGNGGGRVGQGEGEGKNISKLSFFSFLYYLKKSSFCLYIREIGFL